jgi:hypothetical protein
MVDQLKKPNFFIVGAPKCGTTFMFEYLRQHPEIYFPSRKETNFFAPDLFSSFPRPSAEEYLSYYRDARSETRLGDAFPLYLMSPRAPGEIHAFSPGADIIIMLRNPIDMLYSLHGQLLFVGTEDITDFEKALEAEPDRRRGRCIPPLAPAVERLFYRDYVRYAEQVKRYLDRFGKDHVYIILYDDFREDAEGTYRETLKFLRVTSDFTPHFQVINPHKTARHRTLQRILANRFLRSLARRILSIEARDALSNLVIRLNTKRGERAEMNPGLRKRLREEFSGEIKRLGLLLDRDLSYWYMDDF